MSPQQIRERLQQAFPDGEIDVVDLTGTEDHYQVTVKAAAFSGLSRIDQHKKVMEVFAAELKSGEVHALSIQTQPR